MPWSINGVVTLRRRNSMTDNCTASDATSQAQQGQCHTKYADGSWGIAYPVVRTMTTQEVL